MEKFVLLLLFCHVSSSVKHSLKYFYTASSGNPDFPDFMAALLIDDTLAGYCDTNIKRVESKQEWMKTYFDKDPQQLEWYTTDCLLNRPKVLKARISRVMQHLNQSGGVHLLQIIAGCECDEETGEVNVFLPYGYDGEDFISLDLKTLTWIALKPEAVAIKLEWDADQVRMKGYEKFFQICPEILRKYVDDGNSSLLRTDRPSVSLLQKTPSSPVSCHATGFYPDRAMMFWRKDGEELDEDVDRGEILPNHDGTFQMRADLNISSVSPEDWRRYDCVFQLSGVKEDIITKLDKAEIRTNWGKTGLRSDVPPSEFPAAAVIGVVVGLLLLLLCISGLFIWRRNNNGFQLANRGQ